MKTWIAILFSAFALSVNAAVVVEDSASVDTQEKRFFVQDFGALPDDGVSDVSAIQSAIDSAEANGAGEVVVPRGVFSVDGTIFIEGGNITLRLLPGAILRATDDFDPGSFFNTMLWIGDRNDSTVGLENVQIVGPGVIDGNRVFNGTLVVDSQTAQAGSNSTATTRPTITLHAGASATPDAYRNMHIKIVSGTGAGQVRTISLYDGTSKVATVGDDWDVVPDDTSVFSIAEAQTRALNANGPHQNFTLRDLTIRNTLNTSAAKITGHRYFFRETAQGGADQSITLHTGASDTDGAYVGAIVMIKSGTGAGQWRWVVGYDGISRVATVDSEWIENPDATSVFGLWLPMENTVVEDVRFEDVDEGLNIHRQHGAVITKSSWINIFMQDGLEPVECTKTVASFNYLRNAGSSNALLDMFGSNMDFLVLGNEFYQEFDFGTTAPVKALTFGNSGGAPAARSNIRVAYNDISGRFNKGVDFGSTNGLDDIYRNVTFEHNSFHDMTGALPIAFEMTDGAPTSIKYNYFGRIEEQGGTRGYGILYTANDDAYLPPEIAHNTFEDIATAAIAFESGSAPVGGQQQWIHGNLLKAGSFGLRALWTRGTGHDILWERNRINGTYSGQFMNLTGVGEVTFGPGNTGSMVVEAEGVATSVADGGTIAHGLSGTPDFYMVGGTVAGETVTVTAVDGTNLTVSIKDDAGASGTAQNVHWKARMTVDAGTM